MIATVIGGIGLFLLGMILMTDGLKAAAGSALRSGLARLAGGPIRALFAGVGATALVQSSSATVLTTIGFVSAGLLSFPQAIGLILGANLGTTSTGWLVSLIGLKLSVGVIALPIVGIGAFMRLLARGRLASAGLALAGFGLVFVGIDLLQNGMATLATRLDPGAFPGNTITGRLVLVGVGVLMTIVMQSSSAAIATTLTALHSGTLDFAQGAALVIGQNVGTTATAAIAAIGASVPARRTALVHIVFNVIAGSAAFVLLPLVVRAPLAGSDPTVGLAAFHSAFNLLGIAIVLPFTRSLASAIERMVPERGLPATRHLDVSVQRVPAIAVEAARRATAEVAATLFAPELVNEPVRAAASLDIDSADRALDQVRHFLAGVRTTPGEEAPHVRHQSVLHAIDHLERLREALTESDDGRARDDPEIRRTTAIVTDALARARAEVTAEPVSDTAWLEQRATEVAALRRGHRPELLRRTAAGEIDPDDTLELLEAMRRIDRVMYHTWRAAAHIAAADDGVAPAPEVRPPQ